MQRSSVAPSCWRIQIAQKRGFRDGDSYSAQWKWGDEQQRAGSAKVVADAVKKELEATITF